MGVRALRASSGGILDPDDRVRDVADDRETLTAECTQAPQPRAAQADGASGSSAGTASPDMFRVSFTFIRFIVFKNSFTCNHIF